MQCNNMKSIRLTPYRALELHLAKCHHITSRLDPNNQKVVYFELFHLFYDVLKTQRCILFVNLRVEGKCDLSWVKPSKPV